MKRYFDDVVVDKVDFKVDSSGSFQVLNVKQKSKAFNKALCKAAEKIMKTDHGYKADSSYYFDWSADDDELKVMDGFKNTETFINASIYYNREHWSGGRSNQKVPVFNVKCYDKRTDLI